VQTILSVCNIGLHCAVGRYISKFARMTTTQFSCSRNPRRASCGFPSQHEGSLPSFGCLVLFGPSARASCMLRSRITRFADIEKGKHGNGEGDRNDVCIDRVAPIGCLWRRSAGIGGKPCGNWAWRRCKHQANIMWPRGSSGTGYSLATGPERIDCGPEVPVG